MIKEKTITIGTRDELIDHFTNAFVDSGAYAPQDSSIPSIKEQINNADKFGMIFWMTRKVTDEATDEVMVSIEQALIHIL